jgi:hypothetical protein
MDDMEPFDTTERFDTTEHVDDDLERELRAYASARLSPDRYASVRMRAAVLEHARATQAPESHRLDVLGLLRIRVRRLAPIALVAALAISAGTVAGVAASPGGPLYGLRIQIETILLPSSGRARAEAQIGLINERAEEITDALDNGNAGGADAAVDAYDNQLRDALRNAAAQRAVLMDLRASLVQKLNHFQSLVKPNDTASANLQKLIAKTQAAIAEIDSKLAGLP